MLYFTSLNSIQVYNVFFTELNVCPCYLSHGNRIWKLIYGEGNTRNNDIVSNKKKKTTTEIH